MCPPLFHVHAGFGTAVWRQQEDVRTSRTCRQHHALGYPEAHFARGKIRHDDGESADQVLGLIGSLNTRENLTLVIANV